MNNSEVVIQVTESKESNDGELLENDEVPNTKKAKKRNIVHSGSTNFQVPDKVEKSL